MASRSAAIAGTVAAQQRAHLQVLPHRQMREDAAAFRAMGEPRGEQARGERPPIGSPSKMMRPPFGREGAR